MADGPPIPAALAIDGIAGADARTAFDVAAASGYRGIAFGTNHRELNPRELGDSGRRHLRSILSGKHLKVESLRAATGKGGLADARTIDAGLAQVREAMTLARELGVRTVSLNVGHLGEGGAPAHGVPEGTLVSALRELAQQADAAGVRLALSADSTPRLAGLIKAVDFDGARINLEGARAIGAAEDPLKLAQEYGGMMAQFTASDAVRSGSALRRVMLGEGQLPLVELMEILEEHGFDGPWVVDVRDLPDGAAGAEHAAGVIRRLLGE